MITIAANRLQYLCDIIPPLLKAIPEDEFTRKPAPEKWSKKQVLGHLIDSAANNHQRFIRVQFEDVPAIAYDQNNWNSHSHYNALDSSNLIHFWRLYNLHLLELIRRIPEEKLKRECAVGNKIVTLQFLVDDYVKHMEHHLQQIVAYEISDRKY
jgi:hypothetical protein